MKPTGPWNLSDLEKIPKNGAKVFSTFICGGGSTMGYKLAGYEVLGGVEIDPKMSDLYEKNHGPRYLFREGVRDFNERFSKGNGESYRKLAEEIGDGTLDILDGSPPCSSFSMAGNREKDWGKNKKFREGQSEQVLDDLFFDFIRTADNLRPRVVVAENVKGMLAGAAKGYCAEIFLRMDDIGYDTQLFLLNSSVMGVPQYRQRVFFVSRRRDLKFPKIDLSFDEPQISVGEAWEDIMDSRGKDVSGSSMVKYWNKIRPGMNMSSAHEKGSLFGQMKLDPSRPSPTMTSKEYQFWDWREPALMSREQVIRLQSFPDDYDFMDNDPKYVCGMSVPPYMMHRVANEIWRQWLCN